MTFPRTWKWPRERVGTPEGSFRIIQIIRNSHEEIRSRRGFPLWIGLRVELEGFVGCKDSMSRPTEGSWVRLPQRPRPPTPRLRISQTTAFAGTLPYRREGNGSGLFRHSDEMIARPRLGLGCGARFDIGSRSTSGTVLPPPTVSPSICPRVTGSSGQNSSLVGGLQPRVMPCSAIQAMSSAKTWSSGTSRNWVPAAKATDPMATMANATVTTVTGLVMSFLPSVCPGKANDMDPVRIAHSPRGFGRYLADWLAAGERHLAAGELPAENTARSGHRREPTARGSREMVRTSAQAR